MLNNATDIYLDANATAPVAPSHYDQVAALLKQVDGNPSSIHARGRNAKIALENARSAVAALLGARSTEVIFTSGATEANNMAIQGVVGRQSKPHILVSGAEHSSVREVATVLVERGLCTLDMAPVTKAGAVDVVGLLQLVRPDSALVAVMLANNEVGTINDAASIAAAVKAKAAAAHFHCDAVQGLGKLDLGWLATSKIDSAAISAHKGGGFKGIGALYLKSGSKLAALLAGGGQERARRPGTENIPGIVSFGLIAAAIKKRGLWSDRATQTALIARLGDIPGLILHGEPVEGLCLAGTLNFHIEGVGGDDLLLNLDLAGIQASSGSACSSGAARPSPVLLAMGYSEWVALNSVRLSWLEELTPVAIERVVKVLSDTITRVRAISR